MGAGTDAAVKRGHPILLGSIVLFSIIEMSISAWLTAKYNGNHNYPFGAVRDRVRYILFCSIWTILAGSAYIAMFWLLPGSIFTSVVSHFFFLILTFILWLAAAASITASLGGGLSCADQNVWAYCGQLNAVEGFAWLIWILITFSLIMVILRGLATAKAGGGYGSPLVGEPQAGDV